MASGEVAEALPPPEMIPNQAEPLLLYFVYMLIVAVIPQVRFAALGYSFSQAVMLQF